MRMPALSLTAAVAATITAGASASFHLMQIHQAIGGVEGDLTAQAIQLRYRAASQCFLDPARLWVRDAAGANPVLLYSFAPCPPFPTPCTPGCSVGQTVFLASPAFNAHLSGPLAPDFVMTGLIPPSYMAGGTLTFESSTGIVYWRLSWGTYSGPTTGACDNDDTPCPGVGDFGTPVPGPLPNAGIDALQFQGSATAVSTSNINDYAMTSGGATFRNNAGASATVISSGLPCPWDCAAPADGVIDTLDFLALLAQWGLAGTSCDFDGNGVDAVDFLALLAAWGACP